MGSSVVDDQLSIVTRSDVQRCAKMCTGSGSARTGLVTPDGLVSSIMIR